MLVLSFRKFLKRCTNSFRNAFKESLMNMELKLQLKFQQEITGLRIKVMKALDIETLDKVIFLRKKQLNDAIESISQALKGSLAALSI